MSGQILTNNGHAATINGQIVAYSSGSIHVGTSVAAAPTAASQQQQDVLPYNAVIGGLTVIPVQQGPPTATEKAEVIVQGHKLKEGSKAITIDGTLVAYSSGRSMWGQMLLQRLPLPPSRTQRFLRRFGEVLHLLLYYYQVPSPAQPHWSLVDRQSQSAVMVQSLAQIQSYQAQPLSQCPGHQYLSGLVALSSGARLMGRLDRTRSMWQVRISQRLPVKQSLLALLALLCLAQQHLLQAAHLSLSQAPRYL